MKRDSVGELVKRAKGADRSLREYARDSGVDAAILSKMINGTYIPKKPGIYEALTSLQAAPRGGVTTQQLIDEAKTLADRGVTELTVIAQDTSGYGVDRYGKSMLVPLLKELNGIDGLHWVRVLYTYPDTVNEALLDTLAEGEKLIPYLDIPLQHIDDDILHRMHRRGSGAYIRSLLDYLYKNYPDFTLRTTMMVGFPGETDQQFETLLTFLRDYPFDRVGAFAFSPEEGTKAAQMPDQVPDEVKQERLSALMAQQRPISLRRNQRWVGRQTELLIEELTRTHAVGRTPREAPDVDGRVKIPRKSYHAVGEYEPIRLTHAGEYDMKGEAL